MKKGEDRKKSIIQAAERLFYSKGYEQTSIQDILDELHLSKGGFYHHFESKMQLLEAICDLRAEAMRENLRMAVEKCQGSAVDKLNALFARGGFWQDERVDFTSLMLSVAYQADGVVLRDRLKRMTLETALPFVNATVHEGMAQKLFFTRYPDQIGELLLLLFANLMDEVAACAASEPCDGGTLSQILSKLEACRYTVEMMLGAPYGSVVIFELARVTRLFSMAHPQA